MGGLPLLFAGRLGFLIFPGAYGKNGKYLAIVFVLDVSKQRGIASVFLAAGACEGLVGEGGEALGLDTLRIFHWISTLYIISIEVFIRISCILATRMIEDCNPLFFRRLRDWRAW